MTLELPEGAKAGEAVTGRIPKDAVRIIPGLEFTKAKVILGPDRQPTEGTLVAKLGLPFLKDKGTAELPIDGSGQVSMPELTIKLALGSVGEAALKIRKEDGKLNGKGTITPTPAFLQNARAQVLIEDGQVSGGLVFTPEALQLPIPGLTVENAVGELTFSSEVTKRGVTGEIGGAGAATFKYRGLGQADVALSYDTKRGLDAEGLLTLNIPGLEAATGKVSYRGGSLRAEARLAKDSFPEALGIQSSSVVVRWVDGAVEGDGEAVVALGPVGKGKLTFAYRDGAVDLAALVALELPGLQGGTVKIVYRDGQLEGEGDVPLDSERLPGLSGNLHVEYRDGRFGAETRIGYRKGELDGAVTIRLTQLDDGRLALSGGGEVSARITPWLTGRVQVDVTPELDVNVVGEIRAPDQIELFERKDLKKEKLFPRLDIPLWGFTIPVIDSEVGIIAFVEGGGGVTLFVGPGVLRNIRVGGSFSTQEEQAPAFDISGELALQAGAEAYLLVGGGIALGAAVADVEGSIRLTGSLGALAELSVTPQIGYADGNYFFRGEAELDALAYLRFSGAARAAIAVALYGEVWSEEWPLFDWVYPLGLNVALKGRLDYDFGRPFEPHFEFSADELDPISVVKSAMPGPDQSGAGGPHAAPPPRARITTDTVPGARPDAPPPAPRVTAPAVPARPVGLPPGLPTRLPPTPRTGGPARPAAGAGIASTGQPPPPPRPRGVPPPIPRRAPPAGQPPTAAPPAPTQPAPLTPQALAACIRRFDAPVNLVGPAFTPLPGAGYPCGSSTVGYLGARFGMEVDLDNTPPCRCGDFEFRQYVAGRFFRRPRGGVTQDVPHSLPKGKMLGPTLELDGESGLIYGQRKYYRNRNADRYPGDRLTSCEYRGTDNPLICASPNDELVGFELEFRGVVIYTGGGGQVDVDERKWDIGDVTLLP
ncbi:MAG TPA: hypothetical protein VFE37_31000 [Chloroflexota bacterium]|nr:hypothetical protein [Chloroflexota bacterium]